MSYTTPLNYTGPQGELYYIKQNLDTLKKKLTDATDGTGTDVASDIKDVKAKLKDLGIIKDDGSLKNVTEIDVEVKKDSDEVAKVDDLNFQPGSKELKLEVSVTNSAGTTPKTLDFDVENYVTVIQNRISELSDEKNLIATVKNAVISATKLIDDKNEDIDEIKNTLVASLGQVHGLLDNLKSRIEDFQTYAEDSTKGFVKMLGMDTSSKYDFDTIRNSLIDKIQEILNDFTGKKEHYKTISDVLNGVSEGSTHYYGIKELIIGTNDYYGYSKVFAAKKALDTVKQSIENALSQVSTYVDTIQQKVNTIAGTYTSLDKSISINGSDEFVLEDSSGEVDVDNLNKLKNVETIMSTGVQYFKAQAALAMANIANTVANAIKNKLGTITEATDVSDAANNDVKKLQDDVKKLKDTNIGEVVNTLKNFDTLITSGISYNNDIKDDLKDGLNSLTENDLATPFSIAADDDFKNVYKGVKHAKDNITSNLGYMDTEMQNLTDEINSENAWIPKLNLIRTKLDTINTQLLSSEEATKVEALLDENNPENFEHKVEELLPTPEYAYDNFVSTFRAKIDYFNQKKQDYNNVKTQISTVTGQLMDAIQNGQDTSDLMTQLSELENQQTSIASDIVSWFNSLKTMRSAADGYETNYGNMYNSATLESDKAVYDVVKSLAHVEYSVLNDLITDFVAKTADGNEELTLDEAKALIDAITTISISPDFASDFDAMAGFDGTVEDVDIPDVSVL